MTENQNVPSKQLNLVINKITKAQYDSLSADLSGELSDQLFLTVDEDSADPSLPGYGYVTIAQFEALVIKVNQLSGLVNELSGKLYSDALTV